MNYSDFPDLQVDDFCGTSIGPLTVVGWKGKISTGYARRYIVQCSVCEKDPELFGDGVFAAPQKSILLAGVRPCGCSGSYRWTEAQTLIRVERKAAQRGCIFHGLAEPYRKQKPSTTKLKLECPMHGIWATTGASAFLAYKGGCPECGMYAYLSSQLKPDKTHTDDFLATGIFHPLTTFERDNALGNTEQWRVQCGECGEKYTSRSNTLKIGARGCSCSLDPREGYIHIIKRNGTPLAVKLGIAQNTAHRRYHSVDSTLELHTHSVHCFPSSRMCRDAERECKRELECGIVSKSDMPDGWTETTYLYNIPAIEAIYRKHGGVRI